MNSVPATIVRTIHSIEAALISRAMPARGAATAAYARTLVEPLATLVAEQGATILDQAEIIGRLKAELDVVSAGLVRAKVRESQLIGELKMNHEESGREPPAPTDGRAPAPWRQGAPVLAMLTALLLLILLLLFVLPPLDASL